MIPKLLVWYMQRRSLQTQNQTIAEISKPFSRGAGPDESKAAYRWSSSS